jgi:hypothetical protein
MNANKICIIFLVIVFLNGCANTYHYSTGRKGEREVKESFYILNKMIEEGEITLGEEFDEFVKKQNKILNPKGKGSLNDLKSKKEGVSYTFKTGEKQESILAKTGEPIRKIPSDDKKYDEIWEYDFCYMYFKRNKLKKLVFKPDLWEKIEKMIEKTKKEGK